MTLISKLPQIGTTIFSVMSALAKEHDAINLSQGFPEFDTDKELQDLVDFFIKKGHNQYAPMPGFQGLREGLAKKIKALYSQNIKSDDITITAGGTQALYTAITALVHEGDEVILFDPAYDSYAPSVILNGGQPIHLKLELPNFSLPLDALEKAMSPKTRLIIINSPHNPTGALIQHEEILALQALCKKYDCYILSDEVYEHITFDGQKHHSVLSYPELYDRSMVVFSFGKTFHATGWKMGYCVAPPELSNEFRKIHQFQVFSCNTPTQMALAEYLKKTTYMDLPSFFERKRDLFLEAIKDSRFKALPSQGTYFQLLDYSAISDQEDTEFAIECTKKNGLASIPTSVFYEDGTDSKLLRFCFAKNDNTLLKAAEILCQI